MKKNYTLLFTIFIFLFSTLPDIAKSQCNITFKNVVDCQIKFEVWMDQSPSCTSPGPCDSTHIIVYVGNGGWSPGSTTTSTVSNVPPCFCQRCNDLDTSCLRIRVCDESGYRGRLKCCDPGCYSPDHCTANCCGELYWECIAGNLVIGLRKPHDCP